MAAKKRPIRERKAIMIRPDPDLLEAMERAAAHEGISLNKLALEIIETSGRLGAREAAGSRAEVEATVVEIENAVRRLRAGHELRVWHNPAKGLYATTASCDFEIGNSRSTNNIIVNSPINMFKGPCINEVYCAVELPPLYV